MANDSSEVRAEPAIFDWPGTLSLLLTKKNLTPVQARLAMAEILSGRASPVMTSAFLIALRAKGEAIEEMSAFASSMMDFAQVVDFEGPVVDTCGTGGDRSNTINVSTASAFVVSGAGATVCKHGGRAASSQSGSADVLEVLGVEVSLEADGVRICLEEVGIGFCFAPIYHPAMAHAVGVRRELKVPTLFNFLGPLLNPARAKRQIVGISDSSLAPTMIGVLGELGSEHALVVWGDDGLDELTTTTTSNVLELIRRKDGTSEVRSYKVDSASFGIDRTDLGQLKGGTAQDNAADLRKILSGRGGPKSDLVVFNAAGGLLAADLAADFSEGLEMARESISSGRALRKLEQLVALSANLKGVRKG